MLHIIQVNDVIPILLPPAEWWSCSPRIPVILSVNCVSCSVALCLKWVSQLSIDDVVWIGDKSGVFIRGRYESVLKNNIMFMKATI